MAVSTLTAKSGKLTPANKVKEGSDILCHDGDGGFILGRVVYITRPDASGDRLMRGAWFRIMALADADQFDADDHAAAAKVQLAPVSNVTLKRVTGTSGGYTRTDGTLPKFRVIA